MYWSNKQVPLVIRTNTNDLSASAVKNIIHDSIQQWNQSSSAKINPVSSSNNEIKFSHNFSIYGSGVIGVTEVSYNSSGAIQKATVLLNDNYHFTSTPGFHFLNSVFLGDVVTHELGHFMGLSHSEVLSSSMFYSSFSGQSTVSADDQSGIRQKYDKGYGTIRGTVQGGSHVGVLGAHVQAISRRTGEVIGVISDENGDFEIGGLDVQDTYYLYVSPIKNLDSLPGYFSNVQTQFCPASYVGSFFSGCGKEEDGFPSPITLDAGANRVRDIGVVTINCHLRSNEEYNLQKLDPGHGPVVMWDYEDWTMEREKAFVGHFQKPLTTTWSTPDVLVVDLTAYATPDYHSLALRLVGQPFGGVLQYEMRVRRNGVQVGSRLRSYSSLLGTYNHDLYLELPLSSVAAENYFEIEISSRKLTNTDITLTFPSAHDFASDKHLPYLLIAGLSFNDLLFNSQLDLSDNYACLDAPFTYHVARSKALNDSALLGDESPAAAAGCGTIEPPGPGSSGQLPLLCAGFLLSLLAGIIGKKSKNILS